MVPREVWVLNVLAHFRGYEIKMSQILSGGGGGGGDNAWPII